MLIQRVHKKFTLLVRDFSAFRNHRYSKFFERFNLFQIFQNHTSSLKHYTFSTKNYTHSTITSHTLVKGLEIIRLIHFWFENVLNVWFFVLNVWFRQFRERLNGSNNGNRQKFRDYITGIFLFTSKLFYGTSRILTNRFSSLNFLSLKSTAETTWSTLVNDIVNQVLMR